MLGEGQEITGSFLGMLLDFFLPAECVICGRLPKPVCSKCTPAPKSLQTKFQGLPLYYSSALDGNLEKLITHYKDKQRMSLEKHLVSHLNQIAQEAERILPFDAISIPPKNRLNFRKRGFHPISRLVSSSILGKYPLVNTSPIRQLSDQRSLDFAGRSENLAGAYLMQKGIGRILLVDDVMTTGATVTELIRSARAAGYCPVGICVVARRLPRPF